jgi:hypothetical protein
VDRFLDELDARVPADREPAPVGVGARGAESPERTRSPEPSRSPEPTRSPEPSRSPEPTAGDLETNDAPASGLSSGSDIAGDPGGGAPGDGSTTGSGSGER